MIRTERSRALHEVSRVLMPGGVNSPVRAFRAVGMDPIVIDHGMGSRVWDVDGNELLDYMGSWGPLILGHADAGALSALIDAARRGTSFGACTEVETRFARLITDLCPSIELVRMVCSGTEATMSAVRLARAFTGRNRIIKFDGCYHGHADSFLIKAGSGLATLGISASPGVTPGTAADTLVARFNDIRSVQTILAANPGEVAAVILEPIMANIGVVPPAPGFLEELRALTAREGVLLIFDEVITGFRVSPGGAQELYGVKPDLTCLGKIIGGGLPVGAFGGRREIMELLAPVGQVYQAGTLAGNPLAMAVGLWTVNRLRDGSVHRGLERNAAMLHAGIAGCLERHAPGHTVNRVGSMMTLFFADGPVTDSRTASRSNTTRYAAYFREMLGRGILLPPSQFEAWFVSAAHTAADIERTVSATHESLAAIRSRPTTGE